MPVILLGTLDTKGVEYRFVRDLLHAQGLATLVIDAGVTAPPAFTPDITREQVFSAAGTSLAAVVKEFDNGAISAYFRGSSGLVHVALPAGLK